MADDASATLAPPPPASGDFNVGPITPAEPVGQQEQTPPTSQDQGAQAQPTPPPSAPDPNATFNAEDHQEKTEAPKPEGTFDATDFKEQEAPKPDAEFTASSDDQNRYSTELAQNNDKKSIIDQYASGQIQDKNAAIDALKQRSQIDLNNSNNPAGFYGEKLGIIGDAAKGVAEGIGSLGDFSSKNPLAQLFSTIYQTGKEAGKAVMSPVDYADAADELKQRLDAQKDKLSPDDYQARLNGISQLSQLEKTLDQAKNPTNGQPPLQANIDALKATKAALISSIDPYYLQNRQAQAQRNITSGTELGVNNALDSVGNLATNTLFHLPGTQQGLNLLDAHKSDSQWSDALDEAQKDAQLRQKLSTGGLGEVTLPGALTDTGKPQGIGEIPVKSAQELQSEGTPVDPQKIQQVANAAELGLSTLVPMPELGFSDSLAQGILGGASKLAEKGTLASKLAESKVGQYVGLSSILHGVMDATMHVAQGGKIEDELLEHVGIPLASWGGLKILGSASGAASDFFANAAKDSFQEGGLLSNMLRRGTRTAIEAPLAAAPYAALTSENPEQFGEQLSQIAPLHFVTHLPGEMGTAFRNYAFDRLFRGEGAKGQDWAPYKDYGTDHELDQMSEDALSQQPKDVQAKFNATREFVSPFAEMHLVPTDQWQDVLDTHAPNSGGVSARGFFESQSDPMRIFVRSDSVQPAMGWEVGRFMHNLMDDPTRHAFNAAMASGTDTNKFTQGYTSDLLGKDKATNFDSLPTEEEVRNGADPGPAGLTKDMMMNALGARSVMDIMNGQSLSDLKVLPPMMRSARYGLGQMFERMGMPTTTDYVRQASYPDVSFLNGVNPGVTGSLIMEQWMRRYAQADKPTPQDLSAARGEPKPAQGGQPGLGAPTPEAGPTFKTSTDWQEVPPEIGSLPEGAQVRVNKQTGKVEARWKKGGQEVPLRPAQAPQAAPQGNAAAAKQPTAQASQAQPVMPRPQGTVTNPTVVTPPPQEQQQPETPTEETPSPTEPETTPTEQPQTPSKEVKRYSGMEPTIVKNIMKEEGDANIGWDGKHHTIYGLWEDAKGPEGVAYHALAQMSLADRMGEPGQRVLAGVWSQMAKAAHPELINSPGLRAMIVADSQHRGSATGRDAVTGKNVVDLINEMGGADAINKMDPTEAINRYTELRKSLWTDTNNTATDENHRLGRERAFALANTEGTAPGPLAEEKEEPTGHKFKPSFEQQETPERRQELEGRSSNELSANAAAGEDLARKILEERHGPNWVEQIGQQQKDYYQAVQAEDYADQMSRSLERRGQNPAAQTRATLDQQMPVLQAVQESGGFPSTKRVSSLGTFLEPSGEDLADAHAAFRSLPSDQKLFLRQNYGITESKLFSNQGAPLETLRYELAKRNASPFASGQDILDHYYDTLANVGRYHSGLGPIDRSQLMPETSGHGTIQPLTQAQVQALRSSAAESVTTTTATGRARDTGSKAYQNEVEQAQNEALLEAHSKALPEGDDRVQLYRDPDTGKIMATGNEIVAGDVAHDVLTQGVSPQEVALANQFGAAARTREPMTLTYGSAKRMALEGSERNSVREMEQAMSPAVERAFGEAPQEALTKTLIPRSISISGLGTAGEKAVMLHGLSTDKLAQNLKMIQDALPEDHPLKKMEEKDWADAVARYVANHAHGYKGDGSSALKSTEKTKTKIDPNYVPQPIPTDAAHAINMAMADTGAKGKSVKAQEAREFAQKNLGHLEEGEVNPLRQQLGEKVSKELTTPWETIRADLVHEIHGEHEAGPGRMREGSEPMTEAMRQEGLPRSQFVRAGFMPEGNDPYLEQRNKMRRGQFDRAVGAAQKARAAFMPSGQEDEIGQWLAPHGHLEIQPDVNPDYHRGDDISQSPHSLLEGGQLVGMYPNEDAAWAARQAYPDNLFRARAIERDWLTRNYGSQTEQEIATAARNRLIRHSAAGTEVPRPTVAQATAEMAARNSSQVPRGWASVEDSGTLSPYPERSLQGEQPDQLAKLWMDVSKDDEAFKYGKPANDSDQAIADAYSTPKNHVTISPNRNGDTVYFRNNEGGKIQLEGLHSDEPGIYASDAKSQGKSEGGGSALYQAAFDYALAHGITVHGTNLSDINKLRRTSNMLSNALRNGTTKHFTPGYGQNLDWRRAGDAKDVDTTGAITSRYSDAEAYLHNVAEMANRESEMAEKRIPSLKNVSFDFQDNSFKDKDGKTVTDKDLDEIIRDADPKFEQGVGLSTAKRAIITRSALGDDRVTSMEKSPPLARILYMPEKSGASSMMFPTRTPTIYIPIARPQDESDSSNEK
jgi:hypothetical protein